MIHGQDDEWSETDYGHVTIYQTDPALVPASQAERVIYELRLDVSRLNSEAVAYAEQLLSVGVRPNDRFVKEVNA